jgi:uncharacterized protein (DUF1330 family)
MKETIKKILKEEQLNLFGDQRTKYKPCSHFTDKDENELCHKIGSLKTFLYDDSGLGLKNIINSKLNQMMELKDVNQKYQGPLKLLYDTKKYNQSGGYDYISEDGGYYENKVLKSVNRVFDSKGKFDYINKLNTNYADLAELLTELLKRGNMVQKLNTKDVLGVKNYLSSIKDKLEKVLDKYIDISEYRSFVRNTTFRSQIGEQAENDVRDILEKHGMKTLYQGGDGDFIDMLFGTDLIMSDGGKTTTIQVKTKENQAKSDLSSWKYKKVDFLVAPTDNGIIMFDHKGGKTKIDKDGNLIK